MALRVWAAWDGEPRLVLDEVADTGVGSGRLEGVVVGTVCGATIFLFVDALHFVLFGLAVFLEGAALAFGEGIVEIFAFLFVFHKPRVFLAHCSGELFVSCDGVILEGDWDVAKQRGKGRVEKPLVYGSADQDGYHRDSLARASGVVVDISDQEKHAD